MRGWNLALYIGLASHTSLASCTGLASRTSLTLFTELASHAGLASRTSLVLLNFAHAGLRLALAFSFVYATLRLNLAFIFVYARFRLSHCKFLRLPSHFELLFSPTLKTGIEWLRRALQFRFRIWVRLFIAIVSSLASNVVIFLKTGRDAIHSSELVFENPSGSQQMRASLLFKVTWLTFGFFMIWVHNSHVHLLWELPLSWAR